MTKPGPSEATPSTAGSVREALETCIRALKSCRSVTSHDEEVLRFTISNAIKMGERALSAPVEAPVAVKPLEWRQARSIWFQDAMYPRYEILPAVPDGYRLKFAELKIDAPSADGTFNTVEAAKAAAQADYEQRIRSALIATPRPLPSRDQITRLIRENCQAISDDDRVCSEIDGIAEAVTAILTLLGGSAHG